MCQEVLVIELHYADWRELQSQLEKSTMLNGLSARTKHIGHM